MINPGLLNFAERFYTQFNQREIVGVLSGGGVSRFQISPTASASRPLVTAPAYGIMNQWGVDSAVDCRETDASRTQRARDTHCERAATVLRMQINSSRRCRRLRHSHCPLIRLARDRMARLLLKLLPRVHQTARDS